MDQEGLWRVGELNLESRISQSPSRPKQFPLSKQKRRRNQSVTALLPLFNNKKVCFLQVNPPILTNFKGNGLPPSRPFDPLEAFAMPLPLEAWAKASGRCKQKPNASLVEAPFFWLQFAKDQAVPAYATHTYMYLYIYIYIFVCRHVQDAFPCKCVHTYGEFSIIAGLIHPVRHGFPCHAGMPSETRGRKHAFKHHPRQIEPTRPNDKHIRQGHT